MVFGGQVYYPSGGYYDLLGFFETLELALEHARKKYSDELNCCEWFQIVYIFSGEIVISQSNGIYEDADRRNYETD